ncbi:MAG TPA: DUF1329 domain-containing protein [Methylibium sp.]|nr:DUF1329 domain-containing protein [Methylibium sp.]
MKRPIQTAIAGLGLAALLSAAPAAYAAASADEAKELGKTLTRFGAEAGKNADGSIPAYTGGLQSPPAGWKAGADRYADPFAGDKPLYTITNENLAKYQAQLSEGTVALFKRYADYRVDVYSTQRTMAYPEWFVANTVKNATTASLSGKVQGDKVSGTAPDGYPFQGIPFPIPKNGYEAMWNHMFRFAPPVSLMRSANYLVDTSGKVNDLPAFTAPYMHPWSEESGSFRKQTFDGVFGFSTLLISPPTSAGTHFLNFYLPDAAADTPIWFYTPGQRRVRKAPEFAYDVPMAAYAGILFWDEPWGFVGRMDRFDMKLVGKKELIVPYNVFGVTNTMDAKAVLGKEHVNPAAVRWEKRRVWVVEATRKEGARHAYSKRSFFLEEDCWCLVQAEAYDNSGKLWRVTHNYMFPAYDTGGMNGDSFMSADIQKGNYVVINTDRSVPGNFVRHYKSPEGLDLKLSPQAVAAGSVR